MKLHILTFILAFLLTGCSIMEDYDGSCPDIEVDESECINFTFRMVVSPTEKTRYDEIESEWPEFEDRIDPDDFAFFIYAQLSDNTMPFIMKVTDITKTKDPHTSISGGPSVYNVKVSVPKKDIDNIVPDGDITLRIVAFANTGKKYLKLNSTDEASFNNLIGMTEGWDYNLSDIYSGTGDLISTAKLPMYGTITFDATRESLNKSRPDNPVLGGNMYMLRSLAKIKVIDKISNRDMATGFPRIETVTFNSTKDRAYMLPYNPGSYENGHQVETAHPWPEGDTREINLSQKDNVWFGYIPEQAISSGPKLKITVTYSLKGDGTPQEQETFEVSMSGYKNQVFGFGESILRNHIYTLSVESIADEKPILNIAVKDWRTIKFEYVY